MPRATRRGLGAWRESPLFRPVERLVIAATEATHDMTQPVRGRRSYHPRPRGRGGRRPPGPPSRLGPADLVWTRVKWARILYMTTVALADARQNFSALVDEAVSTHQRIQVTRNGVPAIWVISAEDFESIMETLDVLADAAAVRDISQADADADAGRYFTAEETERILAARAEGIDLGDDAEVIADMHGRGLPDAVCMATLEALIAIRRNGGR